MNRKKTSKVKQKIAKAVASLHPYDDINNWLRGDFQQSPWTPQQMADFQKQIDSAFGAENAIVLAWSGDRRYGDTFLNEKGEPEQKPLLLFKEVKINDTDYIYIQAPRFVLLEVYHGSQLESSWDESAFIQNEYGEKVRIRPEKPPKFFYQHLRTLSQHEGAMDWRPHNPCCARLWYSSKSICYGKYREPNEQDIAYVRNIRERMDRDGVAQRNDQERSAKVLQRAQIATKHFMEQASLRKAEAVKELMMANSGPFFQSILDQVGSTMSPKERDAIVSQALDEQDAERFSRNTTI